MSNEDLKQKIINAIDDMVFDFTYYNRKGDEELSVDDLRRAFGNKVITVDEVVERFKNQLQESINS